MPDGVAQLERGQKVGMLLSVELYLEGKDRSQQDKGCSPAHTLPASGGADIRFGFASRFFREVAVGPRFKLWK